jgi:tetratricopeptide (TPR) repeat protein
VTYSLIIKPANGNVDATVGSVEGVRRYAPFEYRLADPDAEIFITLLTSSGSVELNFCYGGPLEEVTEAINLAAQLSDLTNAPIRDPQAEATLTASQADLTRIFESWKSSNRTVLLNYSRGNYYLRIPEGEDGTLVVEAIECRDAAQRPLNVARIASALAKATLWEDAVEVFKVAHSLAPDNTDILWGLAVTLSNLDRSSEARKYLKMLLTQKVGDSDALALLAELDG